MSPVGVLAVWICCKAVWEKFHISQQNVLDIVTPYQCSLPARVNEKKMARAGIQPVIFESDETRGRIWMHGNFFPP